MILRRLAEAIVNQNWFTVIVEIAIVVVGILLGLQANEWSQQRQDRRDEIVYLERIAADLGDSRADTEDLIEFQSRHATHGALVLDTLRSCSLDAADRDTFASGIYLLAKNATAPFLRASLQELQSSGRLTIISNTALRQRLVGLMLWHDDNAFFMSDIQLRISPHINYIDSVAPTVVDRPIGGASNVSWEMLDADLEQLCTDRRFYKAVAASLNYTWDATSALQRWTRELSEVREAVEAELLTLRGAR